MMIMIEMNVSKFLSTIRVSNYTITNINIYRGAIQ